MRKFITDIEQGSPEWFKLRSGRFTASRTKDLMAKGRGGKPSTMRANLLTQLAIERLTGKIDEDGFTNAAMQRGTDMEPEARDAYAFEKGVAVKEVAFVEHPTWSFCTCSPDGVVGEDGLVEIKCPAAMAKHMKALQEGSHANEYKWQLQHQLLVTGRKWVDAVSYDPRYPEGLRLAIKRVEPDAEMQEQLSAALVQGNLDVEAIIAQMNTLRGTA